MTSLEQTLSPSHALVHRLDARTKIVLATVFALAASMLVTIPAALAALGLGLGLACLALLRPMKTLKRLLVVNGFIAFLWVFLPFTYPGEALFSLGPLTATKQGVLYSLLITIKSNAIILAFAALLASTPVPEIGRGLNRLRVPAKLCQLLLFTYRYIHVLFEEYKRLSTAARMRCFNPGLNLHSFRTYAYLVGMVLVRSWERAERVHQAMRLRGFTGTFHTLNDSHPGLPDALTTGLVLPATLVLVFLDRMVW